MVTPASESNPLLTQLRSDPTAVFRASGLTPDPWQSELIRCEAKRVAVLCTRRAGKSRTTAARVLARCLTRPRYKSLVFSPTEDQSKEFLNYVREMNADLGCPVPLIRESMTELAWSNGSLVKAKPDSPRGSRGFTPDLVVVDEGAQVSDELFLSINPMMALGKAEMMILSTPFGKLGWFFDIWDSPAKLAYWTQFRVTADQCPRIDRGILEEHRATMPPRWYEQEYNCHRPTSKVLLWNGEYRKVSELMPGDSLCHLDRPTGDIRSCRVVKVRNTGMAAMESVTLETGDEFTASAGHPVNTPDGRTPLALATRVHFSATTRFLESSELALGYRYSRYKSIAAMEWRCYLLARRHAGKVRVDRVRELVGAGKSYSQVGAALGCSKDVAYFLNSGTVAGNRINGFPAFDDWVAGRRSGSGLYLKVSSRVSLPPEQVVNIQVDSPDHSYLMADGLDNYNCVFNDAVDAVFGKMTIDSAVKNLPEFLPLKLEV